mgnify:CR=1 FL=1
MSNTLQFLDPEENKITVSYQEISPELAEEERVAPLSLPRRWLPYSFTWRTPGPIRWGSGSSGGRS